MTSDKGVARTDELSGGGGRGEEVVEDDEAAEAEAYPSREVRLVQPGDPCEPRAASDGGKTAIQVGQIDRCDGQVRGGEGTEGEAEDGEVDHLLLLRRVGVGGADAGGEGAAVSSGCGARQEVGARGGGERLELEAEEWWRAGEVRHGHGGLVCGRGGCVSVWARRY